MKRKFFGKPRLELLEDRLPPGDLLNYLVPSSFLFSSRISTDHGVLENPVRSSGARQVVLVDAPNSTGADLGSLALLSYFPSQHDAAGADYRIAGAVSQVATTDSDLDTSAPWTGAASPLLNTDSLTDLAPRPGGHSGWTGGTSIYPSSGLEGSSTGFFSGVSAVEEPTIYLPGLGQDKIGDGVANQTLVANVSLFNSGIVPGSSEDIARDGYVPPGWQPQPGNGGQTPEIPPPPMNNRALQLYQQYIHGRMGGRLAAGPDDPGNPGPYATTRVDFNLGNITLPATPGPVEVEAEVTYPSGLDGGPRPLVILMHGRHSTCYQGSTPFLEWPCGSGHEEIPSFQGYQYVADLLASDNYIVASIGANGVNARDNGVSDLGAQWRAQLIQYHLDLWNTWSTTGGGPSGIGDDFIGKVDMNNIGLMGHSRGGEGVVQSYLYNASLGYPYGINAVLPLAPVDFNRPIINNVPEEVILPYCDGDVSDNQGIHFFDDARYNVPGDLGVNHSIEVLGANHNYYNTIWSPDGWPAGTADDWTAFVGGGSSNPYCGTVAGNGRLSQAQQRGTLAAYLPAFFRTWLGGEFQFLPYLTGDYGPPPSAMVGPDKIQVSYHPGDYGGYRLDVNQLLAAANLTTNTLGGDVTASDLTAPYEVCGGNTPEAQFCLPGENMARQPHQVPSFHSNRRGLSQLRLIWDTPSAYYQNDLPGGQDVSGYSVLQFRTGLNYTDSRNPVGQAQDFSVTLIDGAGKSDTNLVSWWSTGALNYPPGGPTSSSIPVPKLILNTVRIPLSAFNVDLTNIVSVRLNFDQTPRGQIFLTDLLFVVY